MQTRSKTNGIPTRPAPFLESDGEEDEEVPPQRFTALVEKYVKKNTGY